jgi:YaiO family outer membrane protein
VTQQFYGLFSFANWSRNFYTTQGFSYATPRNGVSLFASRRLDLRGFYKLPVLERRLLVTAGISHFRFERPARGQIYSTGFLFYAKRFIVEGNYFVNQNQPGNKIGQAGSLAVQYGQEGKYWVGTVLGGGKEVYLFIARTPLEVNLDSVSTQIFLRKWLNRHYGVFVAMDQQTKFGTFTRVGVTGRLFLSSSTIGAGGGTKSCFSPYTKFKSYG